MTPDEERITEIQATLVRDLARLGERQEVTPALRARVSAQAGELANLLESPGLSSDADLKLRLIIGWLYWVRSLDEPGEEPTLAIGLLLPAFVAGLDIEQFPPPLLPALGEAAMAFATAALTRASASQRPSEMSEAVELCQRIVSVTPAGRPLRAVQLSNLALSLRLRYQRTGTVADLDNAVSLVDEALAQLTQDDPHRAAIMSNLASVFQARYEATGALPDSDEAVQIARAALASAPDNNAAILSTLASILHARAAAVGSVSDLEEVIAIARRAVAQTSTDHPDRPKRLANLASALQGLYQSTGDFGLLNEAIEVRRLAVAVTPGDHPDRGRRLANLSVALQDHFARTGVADELDQAIDAARGALETIPQGHPDRPAMLSNLGNALQTRFTQTSDPSDLDQAVYVVRGALETIPQGHPDRPAMLSNLGNALQTRFTQTSDPSDLDRAISFTEMAVESTPQGHPDRSKRLSALGHALQLRYEQAGVKADYARALQAFMEGASSESPADRIWAARLGGELAAEENPRLAADLMSTAVESLPQLAPRWLKRNDQRFLVKDFSGLAADAAALALAAGRVEHALELLDLGRRIQYDQILDVRSDLTDLQDSRPDLASRFSSLRELLDGSADDDSEDTHLDQSASDRRRLADTWQNLVTEIRALPGFSEFAAPASARDLIAQATQGAIAVLNVSKYGSHALLLTDSSVRSLPLPGLPPEVVLRRVGTFREALFTATDGTTSTRKDAQDTLAKTLEWLWDAAAGPVLDALGHREQPPPGTDWPHVWWSMEGPLALLPIHAAGHHMSGDGRAVLDRVVSSYTPTVRALADARRAAGRPLSAEPRVLVVAMPTTPGVPGGLPSVAEEVQVLRQYLRDVVVLIEPSIPELAEQVPTRDVVLSYLPDYPIAHFACHGFSDPDDPSQSRLLLHDHASAPLTVAVLSSLRLVNARLAYLSASQTAVSFGSHLLGEAVNLTTSFHLAGYPHVIGTLWNINDRASVQIAADFYRSLADRSLDTNRSAEALHYAIRAARDRFRNAPSLWAAHIHSGS